MSVRAREGAESIWNHALFTCIATALRPPQRKGLRFHQRRLVSNLLLMATLHPILFPDLLDSIIVSVIKLFPVKSDEMSVIFPSTLPEGVSCMRLCTNHAHQNAVVKTNGL